MPTMVTGSTGSQNILSNLRVVDFADKIFLLQPEAAPLYVLVSKLNKRPAINTTVEWPENDLNPSWSTMTAASATSGVTEFTVAAGEGDFFNVYDLVKIPSTGEIILVTATSTCAITAIRGYAGSTAVSAAGSNTLLIIGSAFEEGSASTALYTKSRTTTLAYNYLQIFRKSVEVTNTMLNSELYGGDIRAYERKVKGIELMRDLERVFLFGSRNQDTTAGNLTAGHARRTSGGADFFISTNATGVDGILSETDFEAFIRTVTRFGGEEVYLFCAPLIISIISSWAQGKLNMYPKDKTYGIAITQYLSPHGTVNLVKDYMLENAGSVSNTSLYGGYAFALKLDDMVYRYLQNRDVTMEADIQYPGDDFVKDQYLCEVGMEFHNQEKHGMLTGVTG